MGLLPVVIISFGFRVYAQRGTMVRHFPEIVGAALLSSLFSIFSTAFAAAALGLPSGMHICMRARGGEEGGGQRRQHLLSGRRRRGARAAVGCARARAGVAWCGGGQRSSAASSASPRASQLSPLPPGPPPRPRARDRAAQRDRRAGAAHRAGPRGAAGHHRRGGAAAGHPGARCACRGACRGAYLLRCRTLSGSAPSPLGARPVRRPPT